MKGCVIFISGIISVFILSISLVYAAPGPWGIAINEKTHECGGFWGGDEFTILELPAEWEDIYQWSENWTKIGNFSECYLNSTHQGPYFTNDSKICCEKNGYKFISKNIGIENNSSCKSLYWFDNENKLCGQKQFCGTYMYLGLQTFESKVGCEHALDSSKPECLVNSDCEVVCYACVEEPDCGCYEPKCISNECIVNTSASDCRTLYIYSNADKECWQRIFCGNYTGGLQTFDSKTQCEKAAGINKTKACPANSGDENGKCMFNLSNGRKAEVKIMPETASEKAIDRLGDLGFTVELKEVGMALNVKPVYELTGNKQGKFLGIFKIMARVQAQVDANTGDVKVIKPWWSFLASGI